MRQYYLIIALIFYSYSSYAVMPVVDAMANQFNSLQQMELVQQTKHMMEQYKTATESLSNLKNQLGELKEMNDNFVSVIKDGSNFYKKAKKMKDVVKDYEKHLKSLDIAKSLGYDFDLSNPSTSGELIDSLFTSRDDDPLLADYGAKKREYIINDYAKNGFSSANAQLNSLGADAEEFERLSRKYESASEMGEKADAQNAILLNILKQLQTLTQLQASLNAVTLAQEARALPQENYQEWDNKDWSVHYINGGSNNKYKVEDEDEILDILGGK